jgi:hypothetical protein
MHQFGSSVLHLPCSTQALARPDEEEVAKTVEETQAALERLVQNKLAHTNPSTLPAGPGGPQYIKVSYKTAVSA